MVDHSSIMPKTLGSMLSREKQGKKRVGLIVISKASTNEITEKLYMTKETIIH